MYDLKKRPLINGKIYGLGGRDFEEGHCEAVIDELIRIAETGRVETLCEYITVRD